MNSRPKILTALRNLFFTYVLTAVLLLALTFLLYQFHLDESQTRVGILVIYFLSCLLCGFLTGKMLPRRRFFWGILSGTIYFLILVLLSLLLHHQISGETSTLVVSLMICCGAGMLGGMLS